MSANFGSLCDRVKRYLGITTSDDDDMVKDVVNSGYRRFIDAHPWSFLVKSVQLSTLANAYRYALPDDMIRIVGNRMAFDADERYDDIRERSEEKIKSCRAYDDAVDRPRFFAVRHGNYSASNGSSYEVMFWPTPDTSYTLFYRYEFNPPELSSDTDIPVGGSRMYSLIVQCCLAAAELEIEQSSGPNNARASDMLGLAVMRDKSLAPASLGLYGNQFTDVQPSGHAVRQAGVVWSND